MDEELLTPRELAEKLKVSVSWIYYHTGMRGKLLPHMKIGKHMRFRMSEVMKWVEDHEPGRMVEDNKEVKDDTV